MAESTNILLKTGTNELELIEFILHHDGRGDEVVSQSYGINVTKVREILRMPQLTILPNLPETVCGIFEIRGEIIPAIDLQKALYKKQNTEEDRKMIVSEFNKMKIGFIVSDVNRIHRLSWNDIQSPETMQDFNHAKDSSVVGFIEHEKGQILMLDVEKIVADIDPTSAIGGGENTKGFKKQLKVLTIDDSAVVRKMIHSRLAKAGFEILEFNDGFAAFEKMQEIADAVKSGDKVEQHVDVVVSDIEMPKMDGYSFTKNVRQISEFDRLPIILFSSMINNDILHKGQSVGATAQLSKPQIGELLETIRRICDK